MTFCNFSFRVFLCIPDTLDLCTGMAGEFTILLGFSGIAKPSKAAATSQTGNGEYSGFCSNPYQEMVLHSQGSHANSAIKNEIRSPLSPSPFAFKKER